jgi:hypothetical protein
MYCGQEFEFIEIGVARNYFRAFLADFCSELIV